MIVLDCKTTFDAKPVLKAVDDARYRNMGHAAASLSKAAKASIEKAEGASAPGTPPHTRRNQLKRAIVWDYDKAAQTAVIGPRESVVGLAGAAHEFGQEFHGDQFPERSYMGPALDKSKERFADDWRGSIGG